MSADKSQKTEQPTPKRKREARQRGQIARSPELVSWGSLLCVIVLLQVTIRSAGPRMRDLYLDAMSVAAKPDQQVAINILIEGMKTAIILIFPITLGIMIFSVAGNLAQVGMAVSSKRLKPDFKRLNAAKGLKQLFSVKSAWETLKAVMKVVVIALVSVPVMQHTASLITVSGGSISETLRIAGQGTLTMIRNAAFAGLVIAAVDYIVQRRRIHKEMMMSMQELKEEHRQQEGNPQVKQEIRSQMMKVSRNRMLSSVSTADVVLVNPTHYAVALKYDSSRGAPEVVAKGAGAVAAAIRARAEEHAVPIVSDPPLTRTIYKACEIGQQIPAELYEAVAKVLAFIFGLRRRGFARLGGVHRIPVGNNA